MRIALNADYEYVAAVSLRRAQGTESPFLKL